MAIPAYLTFSNHAAGSVSKTNVQTAITAAEAFGRGTGFYTGMTGKRLRQQMPGIDRHVGAVAVNGDAGYCIEDDANGHVYDYVGGIPGAALASGYQAATIQPGPCIAAVGTAAV